MKCDICGSNEHDTPQEYCFVCGTDRKLFYELPISLTARTSTSKHIITPKICFGCNEEHNKIMELIDKKQYNSLYTDKLYEMKKKYVPKFNNLEGISYEKWFEDIINIGGKAYILDEVEMRQYLCPEWFCWLRHCNCYENPDCSHHAIDRTIKSCKNFNNKTKCWDLYDQQNKKINS